MIAKIAVSKATFAIDKSYSYFIPENMTLQPGMRVTVPFGRGNRTCEGIVLSVEEGAADGLKAVAQSLDETPVLSHTMLQLASFMRQRYFCTFYDAARAIALQSVAVPGTSEHHLGLAVDLLGEEALVWLNEHCWEYGFIVRYAADKQHITGIADEPWHFRYVGVEVAMELKDSGLCLEEYLGAYPIES